MKNLMKYTLSIILLTGTCLTQTSDNQQTDDNFKQMSKTITTQSKCVPLPAGYTFSWYDHTNMHYIKNQVEPLFDDDNIAYQSGDFCPNAKGIQLVFRDNNQNNEVCAYAAFTVTPSKFAEIQQIAIHPDYRRRGLASTLMQFIESYAAAHRCEYMDIAVRQNNQPAIATYQQNGYS